MCFEEGFPENRFLQPLFGAPGLLNGLKLKLPDYIIELYNSLKN